MDTRIFATGQHRSMIWGLSAAGLMLLVGIGFSHTPSQFFDFSSLSLILLGTFGATLIQCTSADIKSAWSELLNITTDQDVSNAEHERVLMEVGHAVRRDGVLALDNLSHHFHDEFTKLGFQVAVDGQDNGEIRRILEIEIHASREKGERAVKVFETLGNCAPAFGLVGTLFGLMDTLRLLGQPTQMGPALALAFLTTLYGAILANLIFLPLAGRIRQRFEDAEVKKRMTVEAVQSFVRNEGTIILEQRLKSFRSLSAPTAA